MAPKTAQPCLRSRANLPNVYVNANGMARIRNIWNRFVKPLGLPNG